MKNTWKIISFILILWFIILIYMSINLYQSNDEEKVNLHVQKIMLELDNLKNENKKFLGIAEKLEILKSLRQNGNDCNHLQERLDKALNSKNSNTDNFIPSLDFELSRRRIENGIQEMLFYLRSELKKLKNNPKWIEKLENILRNTEDHSRTITVDLHKLRDSEPIHSWRINEAANVAQIIQKRLEYLQNPTVCSSAKQIVCNLNKGCGFGCQMHHLLYCFMIAFGTSRTLIIDSRGWRYSPSGWNSVFQPISKTCISAASSSRLWSSSIDNNTQVIELPIIDSLNPRPPFLPQVIPTDIAKRIQKFHGAPTVWFIGQLLSYLLKPNDDIKKEIEDAEKRLQFEGPIVGVHVRRTDKVGTEASFHSIEEYMYHVDDYYKYAEKELKSFKKKRIYLATDEPKLLNEAREKYPNYVFISDTEFSKTANMRTRYSYKSLIDVILDIHFLSKTDFLVCTFSSQVCRMAYEIMQSYHVDASNRFRSLDDIYYYGGQNAHNQVAIANHNPENPEEIELKIGDIIGIAGNHWNGYSKGINKRTGHTGLYPSYKVGEKINVANFPSFGIH